MRERAKRALEVLKAKNQELSDQFNSYVALLKEELEIPEEIAVKLVTTELISCNEKKLILYDLFSKKTLEDVKV